MNLADYASDSILTPPSILKLPFLRAGEKPRTDPPGDGAAGEVSGGGGGGVSYVTIKVRTKALGDGDGDGEQYETMSAASDLSDAAPVGAEFTFGEFTETDNLKQQQQSQQQESQQQQQRTQEYSSDTVSIM